MSIETDEVYETITSIEEAQKYPTQHRVQFTCVRCGTIANLKVEQIMKTKRLMCTKCSSQTAREEYQALRKSMSPEELLMSRSDMHITDIHEIDNVPNKRYITFNCTSCGALSGNEACRLREKGLLLCGDCMKKHTNNERFGVDYAAQRPEAREKTRQYNLEHKDEINAARAAAVERKYGPGITNVMQVQEHKDSCFESNRNNHGGVLAQQTDEQRQLQSERMIAHPEIQIKATETNIANHGGVHNLALQENREKLYEHQRTHKDEINATRDATNLSRFGKTNYMSYGSPEYIEMMISKYFDGLNETERERLLGLSFADFCYELWNKSSDFQDNVKQTLSEEHNIDPNNDVYSAFSELLKNHPEWLERARDTMFDKYGIIHSDSRLLCYDGIKFNSMWEIMVYLYHKDHGDEIIREPETLTYYDKEGKPHKYKPDFSINGELVEIKGKQFFNDEGDLVNPFISSLPEEIQQSISEKDLAKGEFIKENTKVISNAEMREYKNHFNHNYDFNWLQSLYLNNLVRYAFSKFNFRPMYCNDMNDGKGVTPFDCDQTQSYSPVSGQGVTPFDILTK